MYDPEIEVPFIDNNISVGFGFYYFITMRSLKYLIFLAETLVMGVNDVTFFVFQALKYSIIIT